MTEVAEPLRLEILHRDPSSHQPTLDGAWWPRSLDLAEELPALISELRSRGTRMSRVLYNPTTWESMPPRKVSADGRIIKVGWFRSMDPHLLTLTSVGGLDRYDLLIVPPSASPAAAGRAIAAATAGDNAGSASTVLERAL